MLFPSLRLALSWEHNVVWTACARPGPSYPRFRGFGWCDFTGFPPEAPDSAVFLSDSNLGVGENNPRAGKLMQHLGCNYCRYADTPFAKFWEIPQLIVGNNQLALAAPRRVFGHGWRHTWNLICCLSFTTTECCPNGAVKILRRHVLSLSSQHHDFTYSEGSSL